MEIGTTGGIPHAQGLQKKHIKNGVPDGQQTEGL